MFVGMCVVSPARVRVCVCVELCVAELCVCGKDTDVEMVRGVLPNITKEPNTGAAVCCLLYRCDAAEEEEGGDVGWCNEDRLGVARRPGLRGMLRDGLLSPASLDDPRRREKLDALIERVRVHPALYCYYITDEPGAEEFPGLGKLVAYLRRRDPAHMAYINLFPTYANNQQLGTEGDTVTAYAEHLRHCLLYTSPSPRD